VAEHTPMPPETREAIELLGWSTDPDADKSMTSRQIDDLAERLDGRTFWRCDHAETQLCVREAADGRMTYWRQCLECGRPAGKQIRKSKVGPNPERLPLFDDQLQQEWSQRKRAEWDQLYAAKREQDQAAWFRGYSQYLQSDDWHEKRALVLKRDNRICQGCLLAPADHVHHLTYARVGDELLFDLVAICRPCHQKAHPNKVIGADD
jgi:hypothetical protein